MLKICSRAEVPRDMAWPAEAGEGFCQQRSAFLGQRAANVRKDVSCIRIIRPCTHFGRCYTMRCAMSEVLLLTQESLFDQDPWFSSCRCSKPHA